MKALHFALRSRFGLPLLLAAIPGTASSQPTITNLETLPGGLYSAPSAVSADGSTVVGDVLLAGGNYRVFRWTTSAGIQDIGAGVAHGVNADGSVVVGASVASYQQAFRWTERDGMIMLPLGVASHARGVSADGSIVVGMRQASPQGPWRAFRWTELSGAIDLPVRLGGTDSRADAISADGLVIAGFCTGAGGLAHIVLWNAVNDLQDIGVLPGDTYSYLSALSADGRAIAGYGGTGGASPLYHVLRWTSDCGMQTIGNLPNATSADAQGISGDGSVVVGEVDLPGGERAFIWSARIGFIDLTTHLLNLGVNLNGWRLISAQGISADATVVVGIGYFNGELRGYRVAGLPGCSAGFCAQPVPQRVCVGEAVAFSAVSAGTGACEYQWRHDGVPLADAEGLVSGATTSHLTITNTTPADAGYYDCVLVNACGSTTSIGASLSVCACLVCPADFNQDGGIDGTDAQAFFNAWETGHCDADVNIDGGVDGADVGVFFAAWEAGGCG